MAGAVVTWTRAHSRIVDGAVASAVFLVNVPVLAAYVPTHLARYPVALLVSAGLCLPHVYRRRHPEWSFAATAAVSLVQWTLGVIPTWANGMLFVGLYAVAAHRDRRRSLLAAGVVEVGAVLVVLRTADHSLEAAFQLVASTAFVAGVWMWGDTAGTRRKYLASLRERAAAEERARIARELHDIVSHGLSLMVVQAGGAAHCLDSRPDRAKQALTAIRDTGQQALTEMRHMLTVLRDGEPQPGVAQLDRLVADVRGAGLPVELTVHGVPRDLPGGVDLAAYRIVQEALTNTRKHAGPDVTRVRVLVRYADDTLELRITDDGAGAGDSGGGHGIVGMRERAAAHGGSVHCGPQDGRGFEVVAVLPVPQSSGGRRLIGP